MMDAMDADTADPYHRGEQEMQQRAGVRERMAEVGAFMVRDHLPGAHRELFHKLPFVLIGSVDADGQPHASLLAGPPGFMHTPDAWTLTIGARPHGSDMLSHTLRAGHAIGVLAIEPHTRRRNRLNGTLHAVQTGGFSIAVQQSFGNCPKYIQARQARWVGDEALAVARVVSGNQLDAAGAALIARADTYFIASSVPPGDLGRGAALGVDVSHRGGKPGFVRVQRDASGADTLTVPDFSGNNAFNTLGNLIVHPRAGLLFVDFEQPALMQLSVDTSIDWEGRDVAAFSGALRVVRHRVRAMRRIEGLPALAWGAAQPSPFVQATGNWPPTAA
jgi:uncharacterized protein